MCNEKSIYLLQGTSPFEYMCMLLDFIFKARMKRWSWFRNYILWFDSQIRGFHLSAKWIGFGLKFIVLSWWLSPLAHSAPQLTQHLCCQWKNVTLFDNVSVLWMWQWRNKSHTETERKVSANYIVYNFSLKLNPFWTRTISTKMWCKSFYTMLDHTNIVQQW